MVSIIFRLHLCFEDTRRARTGGDDKNGPLNLKPMFVTFLTKLVLPHPVSCSSNSMTWTQLQRLLVVVEPRAMVEVLVTEYSTRSWRKFLFCHNFYNVQYWLLWKQLLDDWAQPDSEMNPENLWTDEVVDARFKQYYGYSTKYLQLCYQISTESLWYLHFYGIYSFATKYLWNLYESLWHLWQLWHLQVFPGFADVL